jgi:hypothetical protein
MHVIVKELTPIIQKALKSVRYGAQDIRVEPAEQVSAYSEGSRGQKGFVLVLNLDTGQQKIITGSWGGGNMFTNTLVDDGSEDVQLPVNGVVIKGQIGYPRTFATLYCHPEMFPKLLPSGDEEVLTEAEQQALYCFAAIKGGKYREDELRRRNVAYGTVDLLVERGYLKRNRAGATQITTKGKNARTVMS